MLGLLQTSKSVIWKLLYGAKNSPVAKHTPINDINYKKHNTNDKKLIKVYFFVKQKQLELKLISRHKTYDLKRLEASLDCHPVFLKKHEARRYLKFIGNEWALMKAIIPEDAIIGRNDGLRIKPNSLIHSMICGHFFKNKFVHNPTFCEVN